ncbi:translocation protein TolB [Roseivirga sp. BDSF3-8]|uniref:translocation protein TolB n=1 Tax=Roseivirga sp. BDSF3-8 TaxID=3241598 RepID=UPI003531CFBB
MLRFYKLFTSLFLLVLISGHLSAQNDPVIFGKNRIQHKNFDWRYYSTDKFDVYFYQEGQELAKMAATYLDDEYSRITDMLGYAPYSKLKIFIYNSPTDLKQSNVGLKEENLRVGGQTQFVKSNVEVAYPGSAYAFKGELSYNVARMLLDDMMFGGSLTEMFQNAYLLSLPDWYMDGAARYIAYGWDMQMDDRIRDLLRRNELEKLNKFTGKEAALAGQSIWNYIARQYGPSNIANILNLTRIIRNEERSFTNTLGVPFKQFVVNWKMYYMTNSTATDDGYVLPDKSQIVEKDRRGHQFESVAYSDSSKYLAYSKSKDGKYDVYLRDLESGRERKIYSGGTMVLNEKTENYLPKLAWGGDRMLGISTTVNGQPYIILYDVESRSRIRKDLSRFSNIRGLDISDNGRLAVLSADIEGQNDLYLLSITRNSMRRITDDLFDDLHPRFVPNSVAIVFSSNRTSDTLDLKTPFSKVNETFNIFQYDLDKGGRKLSRLTNTISNDYMPVPESRNRIFFLSDQKGIANLFRLDLPDSVTTQVTNYAQSITHYDLDFENENIAFVMLYDGGHNLFVNPDINFNNSIFTIQTKRQDAILARMVALRMLEKEQNQLDSPEPETEKPENEEAEPAEEEVSEPDSPVIEEEEVSEKNDTVRFMVPGRNRGNRNRGTTASEPISGKGEETLINTENYTFSSTPESVVDPDNYRFEEMQEDPASVLRETTTRSNNDSFLARYRRKRKVQELAGPFDYKTQFSAENVVTNMAIDPLLGLGMRLETQMNDLLENHRFYGGLFMTPSMKSGNVFVEYEYLKDRLDYQVKLNRYSILLEDDLGEYQKYSLNKAELGVRYPLSATARVSVSPIIASTVYENLDSRLITSGSGAGSEVSRVVDYYLGGAAEFVFDNTVSDGMSIIGGTRGKVRYRYMNNVENDALTFSNITVDLRHYQPIHRELVLATKLFYGKFFQDNRPNFLLGGVDNWVTIGNNERTKNEDEPRNPLSLENDQDNTNILFAQYVTTLRGFSYSEMYGTDVLLFNAELRLPIARYLYRGPINNSFLRNLSFVGFYDVGSAWTGSSPFQEENSVNTEKIVTAGFDAEFQNFRNPWLSSYGWGVRTVVLGFYAKFDMAWPMENYSVGDPNFILSFGYDF